MDLYISSRYKTNMKKSIILLGTAFALFACSESTSTGVAEEVNYEITNPTEAQLNQGKELYSTRCTECHDAKVIDNFTKEQWNVILPKMSKKAKLSGEDNALVHAYVYWEIDN